MLLEKIPPSFVHNLCSRVQNFWLDMQKDPILYSAVKLFGIFSAHTISVQQIFLIENYEYNSALNFMGIGVQVKICALADAEDSSSLMHSTFLTNYYKNAYLIIYVRHIWCSLNHECTQGLTE